MKEVPLIRGQWNKDQCWCWCWCLCIRLFGLAPEESVWMSDTVFIPPLLCKLRTPPLFPLALHGCLVCISHELKHNFNINIQVLRALTIISNSCKFYNSCKFLIIWSSYEMAACLLVQATSLNFIQPGFLTTCV